MKNARIQRWAIMLEEYGCDIKYKSGKLNIPADMLSRIVSPLAEPADVNIDILDSSSGLKATDELSGEDCCENMNPQAILQQKLKENICQLQDEDENPRDILNMSFKIICCIISPILSDVIGLSVFS